MTIKKVSIIDSINPKKKSENKTKTHSKASNALERSPQTDTVELSVKKPAVFKAASSANAAKVHKIKSVEKINQAKTLKKLDIIKDEKLLTDEVLYFLEPKEENGAKVFSLPQANVINAAFDKIILFKEISQELAEDAEKYGDAILESMKQTFGGDEGFGQYLTLRKKDEVSVCNKLIKEFKNEHVKTEMHNIFSKKLYNKPYALLDNDEKQLVKLTIYDGELKLDAKDYKTIENTFRGNPQNKLAQKMFSKPYQLLSAEERKKINNVIYENGSDMSYNTSVFVRQEAYNWVRDLVGIRMVLPTGSRAELAKVEKYIDKAVQSGDMNITRFSNYHGNRILPYIKREKVLQWKEQIPGMVLVENSQVRKKNGYTTTQMNLDYFVEGRKRPIYVEFQLRTEALNNIGNREHLIYDILENKDITKGIPELKTYYDSLGIEKAVKDVFQDRAKEDKYIDYERSYYAYLRNEEAEHEHKIHIKKPLLTEFGLGEYEALLSFESLEVINAKAKAIRELYQKKPQKTSKDKLEYLRKLQ